jgi:hypothetical protein
MGGRRRRGLADLIGEVGGTPLEREEEGPGTEAATAVRETTSAGAHEAARESRSGDGGKDTAPSSPAKDSADGSAAAPELERSNRARPKYLVLQRKEARLRDDQMDALASLARRMNRGKIERGGERITENTLIRVAVDWLLSRDEPVGASSEEEIRRSLSVPDHRN